MTTSAPRSCTQATLLVLVVVATGTDEALQEWRASRNVALFTMALFSVALVGAAIIFVRSVRQLESTNTALRISEAEARVAWVEQSQAVMVAVDPTGALVGTYYLRPNSLALGAHVANAGYVVAEHCRRQGIGSRLCQHSLQAARRLGFRAMQFNFVIASNHRAVKLWTGMGFETVGRLPGAFLHPVHGYTDALVMFQRL